MSDYLDYQASDAKARFAELLDHVERGATIRISRHGKPVARIIPEPEGRKEEIAETLRELRELAKGFEKAPLEEILAARHEGHKY